MTESQMRDRYVNVARKCIGGLNGNTPGMQKFIDVYNTHLKEEAQRWGTRNSKMLISYGWCIAFISVIGIISGLDEVVPVEKGPGEFINIAKRHRIWRNRDSYIPKAGDIILLDLNGKGEAGHGEIVESYSKGYIELIGGNNGGKPGTCSKGHSPMSWYDTRIVGYCAPDYASIVSSTPATPIPSMDAYLSKPVTVTSSGTTVNIPEVAVSMSTPAIAHACGDENHYAGTGRTHLRGNQYLKCYNGNETDKDILKRYESQSSVESSKYFVNRFTRGTGIYTQLHDEVRPQDEYLLFANRSYSNTFGKYIWKCFKTIIRAKDPEDQLKLAKAAYNIACNEHVGYSSDAIYSSAHIRHELANVMKLRDTKIASNLTVESFDSNHMTTDCETDCSHLVFASVSCVLGKYLSGGNGTNNSTWWLDGEDRGLQCFGDKFEYIDVREYCKEFGTEYPSLETIESFTAETYVTDKRNRIPFNMVIPGDILVSRPVTNGKWWGKGYPGHTMICTGLYGTTDKYGNNNNEPYFPWVYDIIGVEGFKKYSDQYASGVIGNKVLSYDGSTKATINVLGNILKPQSRTTLNAFRYDNAQKSPPLKIYTSINGKKTLINKCCFIQKFGGTTRTVNIFGGLSSTSMAARYGAFIIGDSRVVQLSSGTNTSSITYKYQEEGSGGQDVFTLNYAREEDRDMCIDVIPDEYLYGQWDYVNNQILMRSGNKTKEYKISLFPRFKRLCQLMASNMVDNDTFTAFIFSGIMDIKQQISFMRKDWETKAPEGMTEQQWYDYFIDKVLVPGFCSAIYDITDCIKQQMYTKMCQDNTQKYDGKKVQICFCQVITTYDTDKDALQDSVVGKINARLNRGLAERNVVFGKQVKLKGDSSMQFVSSFVPLEADEFDFQEDGIRMSSGWFATKFKPFNLAQLDTESS